MRRNIDGFTIAAGAVLLLGGALFFPLGLALLYAARQRAEELERGELEDAKKY